MRLQLDRGQIMEDFKKMRIYSKCDGKSWESSDLETDVA